MLGAMQTNAQLSNPQLHWRLPVLMAQHQLSVAALEAQLKGRVARNTLYRWADPANTPSSFDAAVLAQVIWALAQLTNQPYTMADLLFYQEPASEERPITTPALGPFIPRGPLVTGTSNIDTAAMIAEERR
jgi:hypothetical protein